MIIADKFLAVHSIKVHLLHYVQKLGVFSTYDDVDRTNSYEPEEN